VTIVKYLIDTNALSRIGRKSRGSLFVRDNCKLPSEVLYEAAAFPDIAMLRTLEYPVTADVLNLVKTVMATVQPGEKDLIDLYHGRGNADPILIAVALDAIDKSQVTLLEEDWQIVTDDEGVKKKAAEFGLMAVSSADFNNRIALASSEI
jgi:hypothetical protein